MNKTPEQSVCALLSGIVDYAGLFPPSQLLMPEVVANYASYKNSDYRWMLGRFVVPVTRLDEFLESAGEHFQSGESDVWKLSVLASDNISETVRRIENFNRTNAAFVVCDSIEIKAETSKMIEDICKFIPKIFAVYFELPLNDNLADLIQAVAIQGHRAKIRTGGVTEEAFPENKQIIRFIKTCLAANVSFKATAGLHHPLRCRKPLTYEKDAPTGVMNGFINVFLATGFLQKNLKENLINELLEEKQAVNFTFDADRISWRQKYFISTTELKNLREKNIISFGSCSFEEPIADLREIGWL
jgi:hypothetical protein